jgi:hypothetical protein
MFAAPLLSADRLTDLPRPRRMVSGRHNAHQKGEKISTKLTDELKQKAEKCFYLVHTSRLLRLLLCSQQKTSLARILHYNLFEMPIRYRSGARESRQVGPAKLCEIRPRMQFKCSERRRTGRSIVG